MNGLLTVKRRENGYRIYDSNDMNRLKIIRSLRCAGYSLSAILRMLNKLEYQQHKSEKDILNILNTPADEDDIITACDALTVSLEAAIKNAHEVTRLLEEIKEMKITNPPL